MEEAYDTSYNIKLEPVEIKEEIEIFEGDEDIDLRDSRFNPKNKESAVHEVGDTNSSRNYMIVSICGKEYFICRKCQKVYSSRNKLEQHFDVHMQLVGVPYTVIEDNYAVTLKCKVCNKIFDTKHKFGCHFKKHKKEFPFSCDICDYRSWEESYLISHKETCHPKEMHAVGNNSDDTNGSKSFKYKLTKIGGQRNYKCVVCNEVYYTRPTFEEHFTIHIEELPYSCPACHFRSADSSEVGKHIEDTHKGVHPSAANGMTARSLRLKENIESNQHAIVAFEGNGYILTENSNGEIYKCSLCEKELRNRYTFNLHFVVHKEEFPYSCKQCPYRAREKSNLKQHLETRHNVEIKLEDIERDNFDNESSGYVVVRNGSRRFLKCRICGDLQSRPYRFYKHYLLHTQEKPFSCNSCDYKTTKKRFLKQHLKIKHNIAVIAKDIQLDCEAASDPLRTAKFSCVLCGKNFNTQRQFDLHNLVHSDYRPYVCPHCTYRGKSQYFLRAHLLAVHKIRLSVEDIYPMKASVESEVKKQEFDVTDPNTIQTQASSKMLKCESCNFTCSVSSTLTKHRKNAHNIRSFNYKLTKVGGQRNYKCVVCDEVFYTRPTFEEHFTAHIEELPYSCLLCHFRSADSSEVGKHIEDTHKREEELPIIATT